MLLEPKSSDCSLMNFTWFTASHTRCERWREARHELSSREPSRTDTSTSYTFTWCEHDETLEGSTSNLSLVNDHSARDHHHSLDVEREYLSALLEEAQGRLYRVARFYDDRGALIGEARFSVTSFDAPSVVEITREASPRLSRVLDALHLGSDAMRGHILICASTAYASAARSIFAPHVDSKRGAEVFKRALRIARREFEREVTLTATLVSARLPETALERVGYTRFVTEPDMTLELSPEWVSFDAYLESLTSKYRVKARRADTRSQDLLTRPLTPELIEQERPAIDALYQQVTARSPFTLIYPEIKALHTLVRRLPHQVKAHGYWLDGVLIGFRVSQVHQRALYAYAVGIDYRYARTHGLYPRMLNDYVREAIMMQTQGVRCIHFGRTATEIKSTLGATPQASEIYLRYHRPLVNAFLPVIARRVSLPEFKLHKPFKAMWYQAQARRELVRATQEEGST